MADCGVKYFEIKDETYIGVLVEPGKIFNVLDRFLMSEISYKRSRLFTELILADYEYKPKTFSDIFMQK